VKRIHANRMARRRDVGARPGSLEHTELRLQLSGVAAKRVECLADALLVVAVARAPKLFDGRKRGQSRGRTI
jgi:hypothetical protein